MSLSTVYKRKKIAIKCIYSSRKMCLVTMFVFFSWSRGDVKRNGNIALLCAALQKKKNKIPPNKWLNLVQILHHVSFLKNRKKINQFSSFFHLIKPVSRLFSVQMTISFNEADLIFKKIRFQNPQPDSVTLLRRKWFRSVQTKQRSALFARSWRALSSQEARTPISVIMLWKVRFVKFCSRLLAFEMTVTPNGWRERRCKSKLCLSFLLEKGHVRTVNANHTREVESLSAVTARCESGFSVGSVRWSTAQASAHPDLPLRFLLQLMWAAYQQRNYQLVLYWVQNGAWSELCFMLHNQVRSRMGAEKQPT